MPIIESLMNKLVKQYGEAKGKQVYYAMEAEGSGPFAKGKKGHPQHEAFAAKIGGRPITSKKKPAAPKKGRRARTQRPPMRR